MARKMKKFADGGSDRYKARYDRKTADIESDYQKALKSGKDKEVAKAKYNQRMADAKDDLAKWTKSDRTETRAAERAAESALSSARHVSRAAPGTSRTSVMDSGLMAPSAPKVDTSAVASLARNIKVPDAASRRAATTKKTAPTRRPTKPAAEKPAPAKKDTPAAKPVAPALLRKEDSRAKVPVSPFIGKKRTTAPFSRMGSSVDQNAGRAAFDAATKQRTTSKAPAMSAAMERVMNARIDMPGRIDRRPTAEQQRKLAEAKARADALWAQAGKKVGYAKGGKIDGCAVRGKTRAKRG